MRHKPIFSILLLLCLHLLLVDDQDKGGNDTSSTSGSSDDDDDSGGDKPAPQGPGDIIITKGIVLNDYVDSDLDQDQGKLDLQQQDTPGEVYEPSGEIYVPPAKDDTDD